MSRWPPLGGAPVRWPMDEQTTLTVHVGDASARVGAWEDAAHAWYLDGFAPARNPDMWSTELMRAVFERTAPGGTFATYTAAGWVRRNLKAAGFVVEKRPGFGTKRDMMAGYRPA